MINIIKSLSCFGVIAASAWFFAVPDFAAVLAGILSSSIFMLTLLPIATDRQV